MQPCTRERCRQTVRRMNIGNTRPSGEECSKCFAHVQHVAEVHGVVITEQAATRPRGVHCACCDAHAAHLEMAAEARRRRQDAEREWQEEIVAFADMMRVTMLPILPLKDCIFTPRLTAFKGSMPPSIGHMELLVWMQRADFSEHIQGCKSPGDPLNSSHFDAPNTKSAPTGYRRAPNIISHHYKQQLPAKASIVPKARPIRFL